MPKDVMEEVDRLMRAVLLRAQSLDDYRDEGGGGEGGNCRPATAAVN
jgi:hypothetical protein